MRSGGRPWGPEPDADAPGRRPGPSRGRRGHDRAGRRVRPGQGRRNLVTRGRPGPTLPICGGLMTLQPQPVRIILAKVGLDGHDRGDQGGGPRPARRRHARHLRRPLADAGGRRPRRRRRGRRLARPEHSQRRPHDPGPARPASCSAGGLGHVGVLVGGIIPARGRPEAPGNGRRPRLRPRHAAAGHRRPSSAAPRPPCLTTSSSVFAAAIATPWPAC